jgi:CheY-like chemotaxis protein
MKNIVHDDKYLGHRPKTTIEGKHFSNKINKKNKKKVLIIEDQEIARKVHAFYLEPFELTLTFAVDAKSALEVIANSQSPFELILLDIELPDINGLLLAKQLRSKGVTVPIVVISANDVSTKQKKLLKSHIQAFYVKPLIAKQYKQIIARFVS